MKNNYGLKIKISSLLLTVGLMVSTLFSSPMFTVSAHDTDYASAESEKLTSISSASEVFVGGMPFGIKLYTDGLIVVGFSDVECDTGSRTPAVDAGLKIGDIITEINGKKALTSQDFVSAIEESSGQIDIVFLRENEKHETNITPSLSKNDGKYKTGMWLRDSTAGIGTITFTVPECCEFAGLGHGICDAETGELLPLMRGISAGAKISGIKKGSPGTPGELRGYFTNGNTGVILKNTSCGVFGVLKEAPINPLMSDKIPLGSRSDVHTGEADIFCTLDGGEPSKFVINILNVPESDGIGNFEIEVTDPALIERTGGIVQGMSGSPIIQDGKLVGAVTHVLISDPTKGYGIFIENMLEAANSVAENNKLKEAS